MFGNNGINYKLMFFIKNIQYYLKFIIYFKYSIFDYFLTVYVDLFTV